MAIAERFHRSSPLSREPFLALDCTRQEAALASALQAWLLEPSADAPGERDCAVATLYLDPLSALSSGTERMLLMFLHRLHQSDALLPGRGPRRLMAGDRFPRATREQTDETHVALVDHLDKIRVELHAHRGRGVA